MAVPSLLRNRKGRRITVLSVLLLLLICFMVWVIHSNTVPALTEVSISAEGLPEAFEGFRIVQISDLHDAKLGQDHARILALIRKASPDAIFLTGDMIDGHEERTDIALTVSFAEQAAAIAPCYYVTGNHEGRIPPETYAELETALTSLGVTVLHGEAVTLTRGGDTVTVAGIDSPAFGHASAEAGDDAPALAELCGEGFTILLAHHPEYAADYAEAGADLVFSGHVHGGQFRLPFVGGVYGPGQGFFPAYDSGLYAIPSAEGETLLYVSRGLGNSGIPIRFANRPEVILAVLAAQ
ncbi:MAG: metallophosphoesterase [Clostridia bacterium]|nr:metallophosphoesterase [Clostridia bacterium]